MLPTSYRQQPPRSRSAVCLTSSVWPRILGLQLCCDDTLLAAYDEHHLQLHALHDLAARTNTPLLRTAAPHQLHFLQLQPTAQGDPPGLQFLAVWGESRVLVRGGVAGPMLAGQHLARGVFGAAWAPDGHLFAYGIDDRVVICHAHTEHEFCQTLTSTVCMRHALFVFSFLWVVCAAF